MYSIELALIIPIILILIMTALMMFQFAVELGLFEIYHSRGFLLSLTEPASLNGHLLHVETKRMNDHVLRTMYTYDASQVGLNAFEVLSGKATYSFHNRFYAVKNNRTALAVIKAGSDHFFNRDR